MLCIFFLSIFYTETSGNIHEQIQLEKTSSLSPIPEIERTMSPPLIIIPTTAHRGRSVKNNSYRIIVKNFELLPIQ